MISRNLFVEKEKKDKVDKNSGIRFTTDWSKQLMKLLNSHSIYGIPLENVKLWEHLQPSEYSADVKADFKQGGVYLELTFHLRNISSAKKPNMWSVAVALTGITPKKGTFSKTVTGKNTEPNKVITVLDNIFDLRYSRKR